MEVAAVSNGRTAPMKEIHDEMAPVPHVCKASFACLRSGASRALHDLCLLRGRIKEGHPSTSAQSTVRSAS